MSKLYLKDNNEMRDSEQILVSNTGGVQRTNIIFKDPVTGKELFRKTNKIVLAGAAFTAAKHFGVNAPITLPNYNNALSLDQIINTAPEKDKLVCLFGAGIDGCGPESSQIFPVKYANWTPVDMLIPFQYVNVGSDISDNKRARYFGRKTSGGKVAYYFKKFDTAPVMSINYVDGTPVDAAVYSSTNATEVETMIELRLKVEIDDFREFFIATTGIESAKVNSFTLLTAWEKEINGYKYYQDIQPLTKLNIQNEPLFDMTKGLDIIYQLFY